MFSSVCHCTCFSSTARPVVDNVFVTPSVPPSELHISIYLTLNVYIIGLDRSIIKQFLMINPHEIRECRMRLVYPDQ